MHKKTTRAPLQAFFFITGKSAWRRSEACSLQGRGVRKEAVNASPSELLGCLHLERRMRMAAIDFFVQAVSATHFSVLCISIGEGKPPQPSACREPPGMGIIACTGIEALNAKTEPLFRL